MIDIWLIDEEKTLKLGSQFYGLVDLLFRRSAPPEFKFDKSTENPSFRAYIC